MKVYAIPKSACPLRVQISDDEQAAVLQFRDEQDVPFYWLSVSVEVARILILEHQMKQVFDLPDTPESQIR